LRPALTSGLCRPLKCRANWELHATVCTASRRFLPLCGREGPRTRGTSLAGRWSVRNLVSDRLGGAPFAMPLIVRADVFASSPINAINKTNKAASDQQGGRGQKPGQQQQQPNQKPGQGRNVRLKRPARRNAPAVGAASFPGLIAMTARRSDQPSRSRRLITILGLRQSKRPVLQRTKTRPAARRRRCLGCDTLTARSH
jgi:hypothetical protein